jgi:Rieske Fe-S protein
LVSGNGHKLGLDAPTTKHYAALQDFGRRWWNVDDYPHRWSAHDYVSVDKVPFVGRFTRASEHAYVATGFGKWGMSNGVAAAMIISDQIQGRSNRWAPFFDAKRVNLSQLKETVVENAQVAQRWFVDRVPDLSGGEDVAPGEGRVVSSGLQKVALYRDDAGVLHRLSARCTHLGCIVHWNDGDRTWDCPCHGSRFTAEGGVVNGPAIDDLERLDP